MRAFLAPLRKETWAKASPPNFGGEGGWYGPQRRREGEKDGLGTFWIVPSPLWKPMP